MKAKGQPLKTAQARLALRSKLPTEEACLDLAHVLLLEEVRPSWSGVMLQCCLELQTIYWFS